MKKLILSMMAFATLLSSPAFSCDDSISSCPADPDAFDDILYYKCNKGDYINSFGATVVAKAVAKNRIDLMTYKSVFYSTCDTTKAMEIAEGDKRGTISFNAFNEILYYRCTKGDYINSFGATVVAKAVSENRINIKTYKKVFYRTCEPDTAMEIACQ